jgi:hypothetical protein
MVFKAGCGKVSANYAAVLGCFCATERDFFTNYCVLKVPQKVYLGNDHHIFAVGRGDLKVWVDGPLGTCKGIVFKRTLHIPDLACTLISICQLTCKVMPAIHTVLLGNRVRSTTLLGLYSAHWQMIQLGAYTH